MDKAIDLDAQVEIELLNGKKVPTHEVLTVARKIHEIEDRGSKEKGILEQLPDFIINEGDLDNMTDFMRNIFIHIGLLDRDGNYDEEVSAITEYILSFDDWMHNDSNDKKDVAA